jgi:hypothetical protein
MKPLKGILLLLLLLLSPSGRADQSPATRAVDFAPIPIGAAPRGLSRFRETDCSLTKDSFRDCGAVDNEGRKYAFFDGGLSRVELSARSTPGVVLPLGLKFGMPIEAAAKVFESTVGVEMERGAGPEGEVVYASDFAVPSSTGILNSVALIADQDGRLDRIVQRTDF